MSFKGVAFALDGPGEVDRIFRFTIPHARELERVAGCDYLQLFYRRQFIDGVVLMTCFALKHDDKKMSIERAEQLIDAYVDRGGNIVDLHRALIKAMDYSGCYGPPPTDDPDATPDRPTPASA